MGYFANSMVQEKLEEYNKRDELKSMNKDTDSVRDKKAATNSSKNDQESTSADKITSNRPNSIVWKDKMMKKVIQYI